MLKQVLTGCSALVLALSGSIAVHAQTPSPSAPTQPAPTQSAPTQSAPTQVSPDELQKFSKIVKQLLVLGQESETQIIEAIQKQGFTPQRFSEILRSQNQPGAKPTTQLSSAEQQRYSVALADIRQIQQNTQTRLENLVQAEGMNMQRFDQIFNTVQQDPALRQEVQQMIQK